VAADVPAAAIADLGTPARATWNWLGVTMYLPPETTAGASRAIAAGRTGTTLVINFLLAAGPLDALGHAVRDSAAGPVVVSLAQMEDARPNSGPPPAGPLALLSQRQGPLILDGVGRLLR
jgi:hypothetical protein